MEKEVATLIVEAAQATAALTKQAGDLQNRITLQEKQAATEIPGAVEALVRAKLIKPEQAEKVAEQLRNPASAIKLLKLAAERHAGIEEGLLGKPQENGQQKQANAYSGPLGARRSDLRQSDLGLFQAMGIAPPQ